MSEEHQRQILENQSYWDAKPELRRIYRDFHQLLAENLSTVAGETVEIGSGIGNIREAIPTCVRTDLFENPWIDRRENIYRLSMVDGSVANLILFDVFHHLEFPMAALRECRRVLASGGRLLVFDHDMSLLGGGSASLCITRGKVSLNRIRSRRISRSHPPVQVIMPTTQMLIAF